MLSQSVGFCLPFLVNMPIRACFRPVVIVTYHSVSLSRCLWKSIWSWIILISLYIIQSSTRRWTILCLMINFGTSSQGLLNIPSIHMGLSGAVNDYIKHAEYCSISCLVLSYQDYWFCWVKYSATLLSLWICKRSLWLDFLITGKQYNTI